jgi:hypothetical protein
MTMNREQFDHTFPKGNKGTLAARRENPLISRRRPVLARRFDQARQRRVGPQENNQPGCLKENILRDPFVP